MAALSLTMERDCNLELRLSPSPSPSPSFSSTHSGDHHQPRLHHFITEESNNNSQQLTIFYNGKICVGELTEHEARAIIMLATRQMDERSTSRMKLEPSSPQQRNPTTGSGLSMKRSLQRFLQKRKHRLQAASPYNH